MESKKINITIYKWAGSWGPFKVKIPCGECALTQDIVEDVVKVDVGDVAVNIETHDWLSNWWKPLAVGGWHAPIVLVEGKLISQGVALNRGLLLEAIVSEHAKRTDIKGNHVFGKNNCGYCTRAKQFLDDNKIDYVYHDVIKDPRSLYEMLTRVKPIVGPATPITTPQIWLNGEYVGGAEELEKQYK